MTRGDKVRTMSDRELADFFRYGCGASYEPNGGWYAWLVEETDEKEREALLKCLMED